MTKRFFRALAALLPFLFTACAGFHDEASQSPRIVNIINFIRYTEPRKEAITEQVLFETVLSGGPVLGGAPIFRITPTAGQISLLLGGK